MALAWSQVSERFQKLFFPFTLFLHFSLPFLLFPGRKKKPLNLSLLIFLCLLASLPLPHFPLFHFPLPHFPLPHCPLPHFPLT